MRHKPPAGQRVRFACERALAETFRCRRRRCCRRAPSNQFALTTTSADEHANSLTHTHYEPTRVVLIDEPIRVCATSRFRKCGAGSGARALSRLGGGGRRTVEWSGARLMDRLHRRRRRRRRRLEGGERVFVVGRSVGQFAGRKESGDCYRRTPPPPPPQIARAATIIGGAISREKREPFYLRSVWLQNSGRRCSHLFCLQWPKCASSS